MGKPSISNNLLNQLTDLRQRGFSIPEIHRLLGISKSTVSRYCKGIEILPEFQQRWLNRRNASKIISEKAWAIATEESKQSISSINEKELKILGAALYWAEGAKREFSFINSDPEMVKLFIYILINAYKIPKSSIQISLRLFQDIKIPEALEFWSKATGIEINPSRPIDIREGSKNGKLPYGMCRIRVKKGGLLLKTIFAINKRVMETVSLS